ncbi:hypothetical protein [uncultured Thermanaerothrix sp.]|uniref:hypothetical protein n=1 Tax=uncultured Thermanaerothrix sp. TaxID=1195149 RepID=UPI00261353AA|nr:hypothetical protein [uncultured Thermanaerothrix sp.]
MSLAFLVGLPLLGATGIGLVHRSRHGMGLAWLLSLFTTLIVWGLSLVNTWNGALSEVKIPWLPQVAPAPSLLVFSLDSNRWPYVFITLNLGLAVFLTAPSRLALQSNPTNWAVNLFSMGWLILALSADDVIAIALTWTALDGAAFITSHLLLGTGTRPNTVQLLSRLASTFLVLWVALSQTPPHAQLTPQSWTQSTALLFLLALGLRMGLIPLGSVSSPPIRERRGVWTSLNFQGPILGMALLTQIADQGLAISINSTGLSVSLSLWGLLCALLWIRSSDAQQGLPFWIAAQASLVLICALAPEASLPSWAIMTVFMGAMPLLALYDFPLRQWIGYFSLLTFSTLPFTPLARGWQGLSNLTGTWIWSLNLAILITGWFNHARSLDQPLVTSERWISVVYQLGLSILPIGAWVLWALNPRVVTQGWQMASLTALLALIGIIWWVYRPAWLPASPIWLTTLLDQAHHRLVQVLAFDWLFDLLAFVQRQSKPIVQFLEATLESESGILWALILLAMILSMLQMSGGAP